MIVIISPAKTIDFNLDFATEEHSSPQFSKEANQLASELKNYTISDIQQIMGISDSLASLNFERYQQWSKRNTPQKQALAVFKGEVFNGIKAWELSPETLAYAQNHLRILSGMYGILRPLDRIKAYRLEMGIKLKDKNLYDYWGNNIVNSLNKLAPKSGKTLINLASNEYAKAAQLKQFKGSVITPDFKDFNNGKYKIVAIYAKKARGLMTRFIMENKIENAEELKAFNEEGYFFNADLSTEDNYIFTRG